LAGGLSIGNLFSNGPKSKLNGRSTTAYRFFSRWIFMFAGSLLVGFTVLVAAVWLEYHDSVYWADVTEDDLRQSETNSPSRFRESRYQRTRRRWRVVIHVLLASCGTLMIAAGWAGPGPFWIAAWTAVAILMLCILLLAILDAFRTYYHRLRQISEARRHQR
jgi:4-hydroxybenzoate polyprenyltransferase